MYTFNTNIWVYNKQHDTDAKTPVCVRYNYEPEWPSNEWDPGEPELFEITSIVDVRTGVELTEEHIDVQMVCEELEKEIRASQGDDSY